MRLAADKNCPTYFLMLSDTEALLRMDTSLDTFKFVVEGLALVSLI